MLHQDAFSVNSDRELKVRSNSQVCKDTNPDLLRRIYLLETVGVPLLGIISPDLRKPIDE